MPTAPLYNAQGEAIGEAELPAALFGAPVRLDLIQRAVDAELWNRRQGTSSTKTRTAVRGGGRKPFRQKGTGRARQGSIRAPHFRTGGVAHGPHPVDFRRGLPRKVRQQAFRAALSAKAESESVRVLEGIDLGGISTQAMRRFLDAVGAEGKTLLILAERHDTVYLSARNLPDVRVKQWGGVSTRELINAEVLLFSQAVIRSLAGDADVVEAATAPAEAPQPRARRARKTTAAEPETQIAVAELPADEPEAAVDLVAAETAEPEDAAAADEASEPSQS